jgi:hypothetical protein
VEVDTTVDVTAVVEDQETVVDQLTFEWSAPQGTFTGTGRSVKWRAPTSEITPADYTLKLTVVEVYLGQNDAGMIVSKEHRVTSQVTVRVHNSRKELGDMGQAFLTKFGTSSIAPAACLVDFTDSCRGKLEELSDIQNNRDSFQILGYMLGQPRVNVYSPFDRAEMYITCSFDSKILKCAPGDSTCKVGSVVHGDGDCYLTARYEQARWWLCDSHYASLQALTPTTKYFFGPSRSSDAPRSR